MCDCFAPAATVTDVGQLDDAAISVINVCAFVDGLSFVFFLMLSFDHLKDGRTDLKLYAISLRFSFHKKDTWFSCSLGTPPYPFSFLRVKGFLIGATERTIVTINFLCFSASVMESTGWRILLPLNLHSFSVSPSIESDT